MTDPKLDVENFEKAKKQLEDFFECVGDEGLDRDGLHIAWEVYKSGAAKMAEVKEVEISELKQEVERLRSLPVGVEEKLDGFVAWHPTDKTRYHPTSHCEGLVWDNLRTTFRMSKIELEERGWRIRPVRLQFLDTLNKVEEKEKV